MVSKTRTYVFISFSVAALTLVQWNTGIMAQLVHDSGEKGDYMWDFNFVRNCSNDFLFSEFGGTTFESEERDKCDKGMGFLYKECVARGFGSFEVDDQGLYDTCNPELKLYVGHNHLENSNTTLAEYQAIIDKEHDELLALEASYDDRDNEDKNGDDSSQDNEDGDEDE
jgi:hypothetical protein